jgi:hypothetical protein
MKNRSGQVSMEFILLFALVLVIFIPLLIFMSMSGLGSAERFNEEAISDTIVRIVDEARDAYYLGTFNKKVILISMPRLDELAIINATDSATGTITEYHLEAVYTTPDGERTVRRQSEVPIGTDCSSPEPLPSICATGYTCTRCVIDDVRSGVEQNIQLRTEGGPVTISVV